MVSIGKIHNILKKEMVKYGLPVAEQYNNPFRILVSTILSARTKDETTLAASKKLFSKIKKPGDLNKLSIKQIERLIYPVGFYHNKARFLKQLPDALVEFDNEVPDNIDDLVKLPGVGRKTANLVVSVAFQKDGICVDTHVHRIMNRFGYVRTKNPLETEKVLRRKLPKKYWRSINHLLVLFGRNVCKPISPFCSKCPVRRYCRRVGVVKSR